MKNLNQLFEKVLKESASFDEIMSEYSDVSRSLYKQYLAMDTKTRKKQALKIIAQNLKMPHKEVMRIIAENDARFFRDYGDEYYTIMKKYTNKSPFELNS